MHLEALLAVTSLLGLGWANLTYFFDVLGNKDLLCHNSETCAPLMETTVNQICRCRNICFVQPLCMAFSLKTLQENIEWNCKIFKLPQISNTGYFGKIYKLTTSPGTVLGRRSVVVHKAELEEDGFYYVLDEEINITGAFFGPSTSLNELRDRCKEIVHQHVSFQLALIKTNLSLEIVKKYSTYVSSPVVFDIWRIYDAIGIGVWPFHVGLNETEICDCSHTCDTFRTGNMELNENFGMQNQTIVNIGSGPIGGVSYQADLKFRGLCQGNLLGLRDLD